MSLRDGLHENSLSGASPSAPFSYNLTKNLTVHLAHRIYSVLKRRTAKLNARANQLDEAADTAEAQQAETAKTVEELSRDMDALYEDMNLLSKETRNRCAQMRADMHRFFYDETEHRYEDGAPTMWPE